MNDSSRVTGGGESGSCTQNRLVKISETLQTERRRIEARGWAGGLRYWIHRDERLLGERSVLSSTHS